MRKNRLHRSGAFPVFLTPSSAPLLPPTRVWRAPTTRSETRATTPQYNVEAEPHRPARMGRRVREPAAYGLGCRFSIPVVQNGFVPTINNSVAVSFGVDWVHFNGCWYNGDCAANYISTSPS